MPDPKISPMDSLINQVASSVAQLQYAKLSGDYNGQKLNPAEMVALRHAVQELKSGLTNMNKIWYLK